MIEYRQHSDEPDLLHVYLDQRKVGVIIRVEKGWQYVPKGSKVGGDVFATIKKVIKSLEGD